MIGVKTPESEGIRVLFAEIAAQKYIANVRQVLFIPYFHPGVKYFFQKI